MGINKDDATHDNWTSDRRAGAMSDRSPPRHANGGRGRGHIERGAPPPVPMGAPPGATTPHGAPNQYSRGIAPPPGMLTPTPTPTPSSRWGSGARTSSASVPPPVIATAGRVNVPARPGYDIVASPASTTPPPPPGMRPSLLKDVRQTQHIARPSLLSQQRPPAVAVYSSASSYETGEVVGGRGGVGGVAPPTTTPTPTPTSDAATPKKRKFGAWGAALERSAPPVARAPPVDDVTLEHASPTPAPAPPKVGARHVAAPAPAATTVDPETVKKAKAAEQRLKMTKDALLGQMERVDGEVASLEKELEALKNSAEDEKYDAASDRKNAMARHKKETEALRQRLVNAEKSAARAMEIAGEKIREAAALARDAQNKRVAPRGAAGAKRMNRDAAKMAATSVRDMTRRRAPRLEEVEAALASNKSLEARALERVKTEYGLPLPGDVERVDFDAVVKRVIDASNTAYGQNVARRVSETLRKRHDDVKRREYDNAVRYIKQREIWRVKIVQAANDKLAKETTNASSRKATPAGFGTPGGSARGVGRNRGGAGGDLSAGVARSEYDEMQIIKALQRKEELRHMTRIPDMILDSEDRRCAVFDSRNGLIEDPVRAMRLENEIKPWTPAEKKIFHEKFNAYGKNFRRIAQHLERRDTGDCVMYYYKFQKTDDGFRGRRRAAAKKKRAYADAKRALAFNPASVEAQREREERSAPTAEARLERAALAAANKAAKAKARAEKAAKAKAKADAKDENAAKEDRPKTPTTAASTAAHKGPEWTDIEKTKFISGLLQYGTDFVAISSTIRTRSLDAVTQFYRDNRESMDLDSFAAAAGGGERT